MVASLFRSIHTILFYLAKKDIGQDYEVGSWAKLRLLIRFYRNTRQIETLSDFREHMELAAAVLRVPRSTEGAIVECGCFVGGSTANLSIVAAMTGRQLIVFDSFAGLPEPKEYDRWHHAIAAEHTDVYYKGRFAATRKTVEDNVTRFGNIDVCEFREGYYDQTMPGMDEPVVMAFLDVDLIDSLKPCLVGLWPRLQPGCRLYNHEARNVAFVALYFDQAWWQEALKEDAPGFVGSGVGLPLGMATGWGSELGYAQKPAGKAAIAPDEDPEVLERALFDCEKADYAKLHERRSGR
jgi:O-methyltransferase